MPRKPRQQSKTGFYHWITRGINRRGLFHFKDDFLYFLELVRLHSQEEKISIHHYCLMPNHVHILLFSHSTENISRFSHFIKRKYAYYHSKTTKQQGASFERMYKCKPIEDETYLLECARYIERNPLRASLAKDPADYPHSSYRYYAKAEENVILTPSRAYLSLSDHLLERQCLYADYVSQYRPQEEYANSDILGT